MSQLVLQLDIIKKKLKKKIYGNPISFLSLNKHSQQPASNKQPATVSTASQHSQPTANSQSAQPASNNQPATASNSQSAQPASMSFNSGPCHGACEGGGVWWLYGEPLICPCPKECPCRNPNSYGWRNTGKSFQKCCLPGHEDKKPPLPSQSKITVEVTVLKP